MRLIKKITMALALVSCPLVFNSAHKNQIIFTEGEMGPQPLEQKILEFPRVDLYYYGDVHVYDLKKRIAQLESADSYTAVNSRGYLGKYQFHPKTLIMLGYKPSQIRYFLKDSVFQEAAMDKLLVYNYKLLKKFDLLKYVGTTIKGIKITEAGLLAASHLLGVGSVKYWLLHKGECRRQRKPYSSHCADSNGTRLEKYLNLFNDNSFKQEL